MATQSYFRETTFPQALASLLFFPWKISNGDPAPQEFALQFWDEPKSTNAALVIEIMGILVGSKGGNVFIRIHPFNNSLTWNLGPGKLHIHEVSNRDGSGVKCPD